jgi:hypothetical protein
MSRVIDRLKIVFLCVFALSSVAVLVYHVGWAWPEKRCEAAHKWWDWRARICATPVLISDITGRVIQDKEAKAEAERAIGRPVEPVAKPGR